MRFEWDSEKAESNRRKHGVSFEEARSLFTSGVEFLEIYDAEHSEDEDRFLAIGPIATGVICVVFVDRAEETVRILGARRATRRESELHDQHRRGANP